MKIATMATAAAMVILAAHGEELPKSDRRVTVCVNGNLAFGVLPHAKLIASGIFSEIGVTIDWRPDGPGCPADALRISMTDNTPPAFHPGAMAYALPFEGTHIRLFYDRVVRNSNGESMLPRLLAHVMAHEITHILEGVNRHSADGLMKAKFELHDFFNMRLHTLPFAEDDLKLIDCGMARRTARIEHARTLAAAVAPE